MGNRIVSWLFVVICIVYGYLIIQTRTIPGEPDTYVGWLAVPLGVGIILTRLIFLLMDLGIKDRRSDK